MPRRATICTLRHFCRNGLVSSKTKNFALGCFIWENKEICFLYGTVKNLGKSICWLSGIKSKKIRIAELAHAKIVIRIVPARIKNNPIQAFKGNFSLRKIRENRIVTARLSLSMGTTTLTIPVWMAL